MDICDKIMCDVISIGGVRITTSTQNNDAGKVTINLNLNNAGLMIDEYNNLVSTELPGLEQDFGVLDGTITHFDKTSGVFIPFHKTFSSSPSFTVVLESSSGQRYMSWSITKLTSTDVTLDLSFRANTLRTYDYTDIVETKCVKLYYTGYVLLLRKITGELHLAYSGNFDSDTNLGSSQNYIYQIITNDTSNPDYDIATTVEGYPIIAYSRSVNNHLILGECNNLFGLGKWTFTTNSSVGLYPQIVLTNSRRIAIINYDNVERKLLSSVIESGTWMTEVIDNLSITGLAAKNVYQYYTIVATRSNLANGCRIYINDGSLSEWKNVFTSHDDIWLDVCVGMLSDNRPVVITTSLGGIKIYYNSSVYGDSGGWNAYKLNDDQPSKINFLISSDGDANIIYELDQYLRILKIDLSLVITSIDLDLRTSKIDGGISSLTSHNGYVLIFGHHKNNLISIKSGYKSKFCEDTYYKLYWHAKR